MGSFDRLRETLASIHLNSQSMEEMEVEQVVDIPDTPDRRRVNLRHLEEDGSFPTDDCLRKFEFRSNGCLDQFRSMGMLGSDRGHNRRRCLLSHKDSVKGDEFKTCNGTDASLSSEKNAPSSRPPLFRRTVSNNLKPEAGLSRMAEHKDKGKSVCIEPSDKLPVCTGGSDKMDIGEDKLFQMAFHSRALKSSPAGGTRDGKVLSSAVGSDASKAKANADSRSCNGLWSLGNVENGIDLGAGHQHKVGKATIATNMSFTPRSVNGNKRLVRNGCISPSNIALRAQRSVEAHEISFTGAERGAGTSSVDVGGIVAGDEKGNRAKGKGISALPPESKTHDTRHLTNADKGHESSGWGTDVMVGGWRSTRSHAKADQQSVSAKDSDLQQKHYIAEMFANKNFGGSISKGDGGDGPITNHVCNTERWNGSQSAYGPPYEDIPLHERNMMHIKRNFVAKRKRGQRASGHAQSSTSATNGDSEVLFLGSSTASSSSGSSRIHNNGRKSILRPISEVDEHSIELRSTHSQDVEFFDNVDSDAIARQMEEDERLAHELQEQLYNEVPEHVGFEIDEDLAWALQEEDNAFPAASTPTQPFVRRRTFSASRQRQSPTFRNSSNRRVSNIVGPSSRPLRSTTASSRNRSRFPGSFSMVENIEFPSSMDLDMRVDILEALEASVGDSTDLSSASNGRRTAVRRILQVNREFNENDYELLSYLDECNLRNLGLTARQIRDLPESIVQADNFDETCAICLETPTKGETIKHLPCLHKFHKDCIDPWLTRKKLCPICKSSIC